MDLPQEVLADILRRVGPLRHLADCRLVCGYWRATIDGRGLVLRHLLPSGAPRGAFINISAYAWGDTYFFARGGVGGVDSRLSDAPTTWCTAFVDHRNGLLLCKAAKGACFVYNPATRRSATLPPPPNAQPWGVASAAYLLFDPAVSLHHEVFLLPELPDEPKPPEPEDPPPPPFNVARLFFADTAEPPQIDSDEDDGEDWIYSENEPRWRTRAGGRREHLQAKEAKDTLGLMEWPPSLYIAQVFSSMTGKWEERAFVREGGAAGAVADMWSDPRSPGYGGVVPQCGPRRRHAVYWRRSLYVHCRGCFIIRLSLLTGKYTVTKTPEVVKLTGHGWAIPYLSKSQKGVYYTAIDGVKLWVWVLNEESLTAPPTWEMVHHVDLRPSLKQLTTFENLIGMDKSWILDDPAARRRVSMEEEYYEWDSDDDDNGHGHADVAEEGGHRQDVGWLDLLGYHPQKEIVLFGYKDELCAFAYYLRTSKVKYLGHLHPISNDYCFPAYVQESFVYTPCRMDLLCDQNGTSVDLSSWVTYPSQ
uniref:Uncharacterized protein n=1 Tax=Avena sativa TaxID=4498 RepID=A0ACD5WGW0_AVESA